MFTSFVNVLSRQESNPIKPPYDRHGQDGCSVINHFMAILDFVRDYLSELEPERQNLEGKTNLDLLEQEIMSNGISWAICKSAP